ncbi:MAG: hypothetical protein R3B57_11105 [Phycisphaerales bacterium]
MRSITAALTLAALSTTALAGVRVDLFVFENQDSVPTGNIDIWVDVVDNGSTIDFVWHNDSTEAANLTSIYIENSNAAGLLSNANIMNVAGVQYSSSATPPNPAGSIQFFGGAWQGNIFSADPDTPQPNVNAINPGESLTTRFDYSGGLTYQMVIDSLLDPDFPTAFRLAGHVQGIGAGDSSIWVVSPAPGSAGLLAGAALLGARRRRRH